MNNAKPATASDVVVLDALRASPMVDKAIADRGAAVIAERRKLREQLAEVESGEPCRAYLGAVKRHEAAIEAAKVAWASFQAAEQKVAEAETARVSASIAIREGRQEIMLALHASANNAAIDAFIHWARDEMQSTRKAAETREVVSRHRITGARTIKYESNTALITARVLALSEAINQAEDLRCEADQSTVPDHIAALKQGLPPAVSPIASSGKDV